METKKANRAVKIGIDMHILNRNTGFIHWSSGHCGKKNTH